MIIDADDFWSRVEVLGPDDCWPWIKGKFSNGYGQYRGKRAHRVAFFLTYGHWPTPCGLHTCDNPPCCNPKHIFEGTHKDNAEDRERKGRRGTAGWRPMPGEMNGSSVLTESQVVEIRELYWRLYSERLSKYGLAQMLSKRFGVSPITIRDIIKRRTWRHIP